MLPLLTRRGFGVELMETGVIDVRHRYIGDGGGAFAVSTG